MCDRVRAHRVVGCLAAAIGVGATPVAWLYPRQQSSARDGGCVCAPCVSSRPSSLQAFMDRPPTPIFVPAKVGRDQATQIESGDLFDFDAEVEPILEVLVGKTLEQSLMEVHEDLELDNIRKRQVGCVCVLYSPSLSVSPSLLRSALISF